MNKINSFAVYREYWDLITLLNEKEQLNVLMAVFKYMFEDEEIKLSDREKKVFVNLKRPLDKSKNKANSGRTKQSQNEIKSKSKENQNEAKMKSNQNQNEIKKGTHQDVNVIVNDNVYVYVENKLNRTLNSSEIELIGTWDYKPYQIEYAINQTLLARANNLKYTNAILRNIKDKTEDELKENIREEKPDIEIPDYDWLNENN